MTRVDEIEAEIVQSGRPTRQIATLVAALEQRVEELEHALAPPEGQTLGLEESHQAFVARVRAQGGAS